jgi:hypothetical protein
MEQKKETRAQLERRINNAIIFIPKDKDTKSVFFSDKGIRLTVTNDTAIIETNYHRHVFSNFTSFGLSRPYLYTKQLVDMANENDCKTSDGYSYERLMNLLKEKENKGDYNIFWYIDKWLYNIFQPLYSIGESDAEAFLVYESYIHNMARNSVVLSEKVNDITNKDFINSVCDSIKEFTEELEEHVLFPKKTDEELMQENIEAIQEQEQNDAMEAQLNGAE